MSVRKREWKTPKGEARSAWAVDYVDGQGVRRQKTFPRKKEADAFHAKATVEVAEGIHVADSASITVKEAGRLWQEAGEAAGLQRTSLDQRRQHLKLHIEPLIGDVLLSKLTVARVRQFTDDLREQGRSPRMVRIVTTSLGALISEAQERTLARTNPVRDLSRAKMGKGKRLQRLVLKVGRDIPEPGEVKAFLSVLTGRWKPLFMVAVFTGLRASELRGLPWRDVDFANAELHVTQRIDEFGKVDMPKSEAGQRTIPLPPALVAVLKEWKLQCPRGELGLVFPNGQGNPESLSNIRRRGQEPAMVKAGVSLPTGKVDKKGRPIFKAKYGGAHALRHFFASWCINPVAAGGRGLNAKAVQTLMGHSTITLTLDRYAHLFPSGDDGTELAAAERALLG